MAQQLNILLIEDDESFAILVRRILKQLEGSHQVTHVVRLADACQLLTSQTFDLVVTDLTLPDASRLDTVQRVRAECPDIPVIVLTLIESTELISEAAKIGAQDFIIKDSITPPMLERSIQNAVERQKMVAENAHLIETLKQQQERLNEKNSKLEHLLETTHRFVDNVSHEFRTPLTVIREYAALMGEGLLGEVNDQQSEFLTAIVCRVDDLNRMVDDMLDSSKLEAGIMGTHRTPATASAIVTAPLEGLRLKAMARGIQLTSELPPDLPEVFCDVEKASRVITNLVANALKFTQDDTGIVHVSASHLFDDNDVEFCVTDNGPGISSDQLARLFERFEQLGTSTASSTKGFGLGLNIARELVDLNYGRIRVESEEGVGTSFFFTVPVNDWSEVVRRYCERLAPTGTQILVARISGPEDLSESEIRDMEAFWRFTQRQTDLIHRVGPSQWRLLAACDRDQGNLILDRFQTELKKVSRGRPRPLPKLEFESLGFFSPEDMEPLIEVVGASVPCAV